ncbi:hypothetical protein E2C00_00250 [Streptomyces sp. WAC05374]|uniref:hypothetical protein n=1 Tax=Streptomyces sp. WAC05374 TaxID=2487420 RepID=UPI000F86DF6A|nr:hypothetical protein [Streptomyces sp. WAC05374]RST19639.1 hypothetical protein EF905_00695 [Streptomyces sp. WAC05374]TDF50023.1 hypothetical protein E2B92_00225 [Streptomyces sp. WAC05374]TDF57749.1 hypothetical protein E2C02_08015 [Streptomyces sp. WAC05374]TDF60277.1 hypothetical protein E2C00_00250 [Streptomyces sp. WAC05374]
MLTDHYVDLGLFLDFNDSDRLEFLEVTPVAGVFLGSVPLLGRSYREVVAELREAGLSGSEDESGVEYSDQCFALFCSAPFEDDSIVEGVTVFAPGYYD